MAGIGIYGKLGWFATFLKSQFLTTIPYPTADFSGQTVVVTGSNTGLGLEAARHLVRLGAAKVILAVRTISKGEAAAKNIVTSCQAPKTTVEVWQLDMSDTDSIKSFAKRASKLERLDAAILNAGILTQQFQMRNGVEGHIGVNVVGTLLLTCLLLPNMRQSAAQTGHLGRLTIIGSDTMYLADIRELLTDGSILEKLNDPTVSVISQRYPLSKLLVFYSVRELARGAPLEVDVLLNVLTPGACKSDIFRDDADTLGKIMMGVGMAAIGRTTEVGGRTLVFGVTPDLPVDVHGRFVWDNKIAPNGTNVDGATGQELAGKWNAELFAYLEKVSPGCTKL